MQLYQKKSSNQERNKRSTARREGEGEGEGERVRVRPEERLSTHPKYSTSM